MTVITFLQMVLVINVVCTVITDMTDWSSTMKRIVSWLATKGRLSTDRYDNHLIDCSLCQTFHLTNLWLVIYLLLGGVFHPFLIAVPVLSALCTNLTKSVLFMMMDVIQTCINLIYKILDRLK